MIDSFYDTVAYGVAMRFDNTPVDPPGYARGIEVAAVTPGQAMLGGYRNMYLRDFSHISGDGLAFNEIGNLASGPFDPPMGYLVIRTDMGGTATADVIWDGQTPGVSTDPLNPTEGPAAAMPLPPVNPMGLPPTDLTLNSEDEALPAALQRHDANGFYLDLLLLSAATPVTLSVWDVLGTQASATLSSAVPLSSFLFFPFASFAGIDFTRVTALQLSVVVPAAPATGGPRDFEGLTLLSLDTRRLVPEPASLWLGATGLLGLAWSRRRKAR